MSTKNNVELTVSDVMLDLSDCPVVSTSTILKDAFNKMDICGLGIVCITSQEGTLEGILTEGDIRRLLLRVQKPFAALLVDDVKNYANTSAITTTADTILTNAINIMSEKKVWDLPVVNKTGILIGMLHLHQAISYLLKKQQYS